jgi:hypothetical protein
VIVELEDLGRVNELLNVTMSTIFRIPLEDIRKSRESVASRIPKALTRSSRPSNRYR